MVLRDPDAQSTRGKIHWAKFPAKRGLELVHGHCDRGAVPAHEERLVVPG